MHPHVWKVRDSSACRLAGSSVNFCVTQKKQILQSITTDRPIDGGREITLTFRVNDGAPVPAVFLLPARPTAIPAAVLLHGYGSHKEVMAEAFGRALFDRGIASLAIDLPLHGARSNGVQRPAAGNPMAMLQLTRTAVEDARTALHYLAARPELDRGRIAVAGYSLGSFLALRAAADQPLITAVILAAGGDLPLDTPYAAFARMAADPVRGVAMLHGRPLLMLNGRSDPTIGAADAQRLYDAAPHPKQIIWYDAGHVLPRQAGTDAAAWLGERLTPR